MSSYVRCVGRIARTQYQKFETNIHRKGIAQPQFQFPHSCVCERFRYSHDRLASSAAGKYVGRSWEYINRSQAAQFLFWEHINGIFVAVRWSIIIDVVAVHSNI